MLSFFLLMLSGLISCVGLCKAGSPIEVERASDDDPAHGKKVHPLQPGMPGYSGE